MDLKSLYQIYLQSNSITTDSRRIQNGVLYFALRGEKFDGNAFAAEALRKGATFAIIDNPQYKSDDNRLILVDDVLLTLQKLANYHRKQLKLPVLAITGTNGKTTTKELVKSVIAQKYNVLATEGNLNNHIGVPLTLLSIKPYHNFAIIEMGANHPNEINDLCEIAEPDFGIITNIGKAHLEGFGGFQGVIKTKKELYDFLERNKGVIFYNSDNYLLVDILLHFQTTLKSYGMNTGQICKGRITSCEPFVEAMIECNDQSIITVKTNLIGNYNFENILAAVAIGKEFGVNNVSITKALSEYKPVNNRSQYQETGKNKLFVDCYNANPSSTELALLNFISVRGDNKIAILGDMLELGEESEAEHQKIIELLISKKCDVLLVGPVYNKVAKWYKLKSFETVDELKKYAGNEHIINKIILIKGSRGIQLEKVIEDL